MIKVMIQEDKLLLLQDLSARLSYEVHLFTNSKHHIRLLTISRDLDYDEQYWINGLYDIDEVKPYLRPMSSMTEEEKKEFESFGWRVNEFDDNYPWVHIGQIENVLLGLNWLNANHFDYRGLIEKGLAIAVTEENNPYKE